MNEEGAATRLRPLHLKAAWAIVCLWLIADGFAIMVYVGVGSLGDEIRTDQLLPLGDRKADVTYEKIVLRRSNWLEGPLSEPETDLAYVSSEGLFLAEGSRCSQTLSNVRVGSESDIPATYLERLELGVKRTKSVRKRTSLFDAR